MKFSAFARFGHLRFSGKRPLAQRMYESMRDGMKEAFDMTKGTYQEAKTFSMAMGLARARLTVERANNQLDPLKAKEKLPSLERDFGLSPSGNATILERQREVSARKKLLLGSKEGAITAALQTLLGANFVAYRVTKDAERVVYPASPGAVGTWPRKDATLKWIKLLDPVAVTGAPVTVRYEIVNGLKTHPGGIAAIIDGTDYLTYFGGQTSLDPQVGEKLTIEPEIPGIAEAVTITAITAPTGLSVTVPTFAGEVHKSAGEADPWSLTATFTKAHTSGCHAHNAVAFQTSSQREVRVIVKSAVIVDAETRRKINELLSRAVREVTRWQILEEGSPGTTSVWVVPNRLIGKSILAMTI